MSEMKELLATRLAVRSSRAQKRSFLAAATEEFLREGYTVSQQNASRIGLYSENLIAGDLRGAKTVIVAHYDTPRSVLLPFFVCPQSSWGTFLGTSLLWLVPALLAALASGAAATGELFVPFFLLAGYGAAGVAVNQNNANDNSSGVLALFETARRLKGRPGVAFALLDNNELFHLGAASLRAQFDLREALVIDLDCVGRGELLVAARENDLPAAQTLAGSWASAIRRATVFPADARAFAHGLLVTAGVNARGGWQISNIHSTGDRTIEEENIAQISAMIDNFLGR